MQSCEKENQTVIAGTGSLRGLLLHADQDPQTAARAALRPAGSVGRAVCAGWHAR